MRSSTPAAESDARICSVCNRQKPISAFLPTMDGVDGHSHVCRVCTIEAAHEQTYGIKPTLSH